MKSRDTIVLTTALSLLTSAASIAADFQVELGEPVTVANPKPGVPIYPWFPDGHITVLPDKAGLQMYWAGSASYRTVGAAVDTMRLSPAKPILAKGEPATAFDNGGAWLYSVVAVSNADYIGFYHAEDHQWQTGRSADGVAWKSVALCTSGDGGATWSKKGQILTSARQKPDLPAWGGCGDHCVVFDKGRWFCFFQEHYLCMAVSDDKQALPGTWKKWYNGGFNEPGLGGKVSPIEGLVTRPGGNPSVHYNTELQRWFMVWHTWTGNLVYSWSRDLIRWEPPVDLLKCAANTKLWYPTIVGSTDTQAGKEAALYYAFWPDKTRWERQFIRRTIRFVHKAGTIPTQSR